MPLVNAKCTNCGAALTVDASKDAAICEFCGSAFIVEKAINNYNITNHNHINADVVNVYTGASTDYDIRVGRLIKYRGASVDAVIPEGVVVIGANAFSGLDRLRSVTIPRGVEVIEQCAFSGCTSLSQIIIPDTVEHIDEYAFENCINLTSITIPDRVAHLPIGVFDGCSSLHQVTYPHLEENAAAFKKTPIYIQRWGVEWTCQFCGQPNPPDAAWCLSCGIENIDMMY
ncbi:MAG: leucine-rich repeat domain-containing protein [Oscillospiraceae bacterium]|nr:leucine-rich repeat domain-containing protein [Oscillospiraceae bacterium]